MFGKSKLLSNVLKLANTNPDVLDSYNTLILKYWIFFDNLDSIEGVKEATSSESITRAFRKLVELGHISLPKHEEKRRKEAQKQYKNDFARMR